MSEHADGQGASWCGPITGTTATRRPLAIGWRATRALVGDGSTRAGSPVQKGLLAAVSYAKSSNVYSEQHHEARHVVRNNGS